MTTTPAAGRQPAQPQTQRQPPGASSQCLRPLPRALALRGGSREHRFLCTLQAFDERIGAGSHLAATFAEVLHALREAEAEAACALTLVLGPGSLSFEVHRLLRPAEVGAYEKKRLCHVWLPQQAEDIGGSGWCGAYGTYARRALVLDLASPYLPRSGCAPPPVPLERLYKGAWELQRPGQVRAKGAALRAWASSALRAWAALPLPPLPIASWERSLLVAVRRELCREYRGFLEPAEYPGTGAPAMQRASSHRTVLNEDGVVVRAPAPGRARSSAPGGRSSPARPHARPSLAAAGVQAGPQAAQGAAERRGGRHGGGAGGARGAGRAGAAQPAGGGLLARGPGRGVVRGRAGGGRAARLHPP